MKRRSVFNAGGCFSLAGGLFLLPCLAVQVFAASSKTASSKQRVPSSALSSEVASAIRSASKEKVGAIVRIRCSDAQGEVNGTGFYIDPTGTICTLLDIVRAGGNITVLQDGREYPASLCAVDPRSGVAFLKVDLSAIPGGGRSFLSPRSITSVPTQTPVLGMGVPSDEVPSVSLGMITGSATHQGERFFCVPHLIAELMLCEGEGGAPIIDLSGGLVGMVIYGTSKGGEFAVLPAGAIEKLHGDLLRLGGFSQGWVGVAVEEAAVPQGNSRTRIAAVEMDSPAEAAGLRTGDMILSIGGRSIAEPEEVLEASFYLSAGESVGMGILRAGKLRKVQLHCGAPRDVSVPMAQAETHLP